MYLFVYILQKKKCNDNSKIANFAVIIAGKIVAEGIRFIIPRNSYTDVIKDTWHSG